MVRNPIGMLAYILAFVAFASSSFGQIVPKCTSHDECDCKIYRKVVTVGTSACIQSVTITSTPAASNEGCCANTQVNTECGQDRNCKFRLFYTVDFEDDPGCLTYSWSMKVNGNCQDDLSGPPSGDLSVVLDEPCDDGTATSCSVVNVYAGADCVYGNMAYMLIVCCNQCDDEDEGTE